MTYARVRLFLGMSCVGLCVVTSLGLLAGEVPGRFLVTSTYASWQDLRSLAIVIVSPLILLAPFDYLGGYLAPTRYHRQSISLNRFLRKWLLGVSIQASLFLLTGLLILSVGRAGGLLGVSLAVASTSILYLAFQKQLVLVLTRGRVTNSSGKLASAVEITARWGFRQVPVITMQHTDPGFTGGVVGLPRFESIVLPADFLNRLTADQLAIVLARRLAAIESGSRTRGILLALAWVIGGFLLSSLAPSAGVTTVSQLATTCLYFTLWSFIGLLILPTVSRQTAYALDNDAVSRGVDPEALDQTVRLLDSAQDDEPSRSTLIETIFHPVPSVENRSRGDDRQSHAGATYPLAWHTARMTLFLSWSCMGLLARAVHCNVGRPELWPMLPTD